MGGRVLGDVTEDGDATDAAGGLSRSYVAPSGLKMGAVLLCEDFRLISVSSADLESLSEAAVVFVRDGELFYCEAGRVVGVEFE